MNKISKKIIYILLAVVLIMMSFLVTNVYALTDSEAELVQILTEYKDELGDLNQFKDTASKEIKVIKKLIPENISMSITSTTRLLLN